MKDFLSLQETFSSLLLFYLYLWQCSPKKWIFFFFLGIYGKLDVLYAGIVAENACAENKNRSDTHAFIVEVGCTLWNITCIYIFRQ